MVARALSFGTEQYRSVGATAVSDWSIAICRRRAELAARAAIIESCGSPVWPQIMLEAESMVGEACYKPTNITRGHSVKDGI